VLAGYLLMNVLLNPRKWVSAGPFNVQIGRLLLYLAFFAGGFAIGAHGLERGAFRPLCSIYKRINQVAQLW
jgi:hypothetical protein